MKKFLATTAMLLLVNAGAAFAACEPPARSISDVIEIMSELPAASKVVGLVGPDATKMHLAITAVLGETTKTAPTLFMAALTDDIAVAAAFDKTGCSVAGGILTIDTIDAAVKQAGVKMLELGTVADVRIPSPTL